MEASHPPDEGRGLERRAHRVDDRAYDFNDFLLMRKRKDRARQNQERCNNLERPHER